MLTPRQDLLLSKVVDGFAQTGQPVGSKTLAADPDVTAGPSTIRNELAVLEENGLLAHPHTSAGRVPTDAGYRYYVDRLLPAPSQAARTRRAAATGSGVPQIALTTATPAAPVDRTRAARAASIPPIATHGRSADAASSPNPRIPRGCGWSGFVAVARMTPTPR